MSDISQNTVLSIEIRRAIDAWLRKYPADQKQSGVIYALTQVQAEHGGYLTTELMDAVAEYLGMPKIAVYEVATFYHLFELSPVGPHKLCICTNISCMLKGSDAILEHLKEKVGADPRFTIKEVECLAACGGAPVMQWGSCYHENLTPEKIDILLEAILHATE
jgi:NADH-quinone oxidoreductase subunit E